MAVTAIPRLLERYRKEILLPRPFTAAQATLKCNNGVVELWLKDAAP